MTRHLLTAMALAIPGVAAAALPAFAAPRGKAPAKPAANTPAKPAAPVQQALEPTDVTTNMWEAGTPGKTIMTVTYPESVVDPADVGRADTLGVAAVSPALELETEWVSTYRLEVRAKGAMQPKTAYGLRLADGVKGKSGKLLKGSPKTWYMSAERLNTNASESSTVMELGQGVFFSAYQGKQEALLAQNVQEAAIETVENPYSDNERVVSTRKAAVRPATVADVLANWESYKSSCDWQAGVKDADKDEFRKLPPDEVLPGQWYTEMPVPGPNQRVALVLPRLGNVNEETGVIGSADIVSLRLPHFEYDLARTRTGLGKYDITLSLEQPVDPQVLEQALAQAKWTFSAAPAPGAKVQEYPMAHEYGVCLANVDGREVVLRYDAEATAKLAKEYKTAKGTARGVVQAVFHMDTDGLTGTLAADMQVRSIHGDDFHAERWGRKNVEHAECSVCPAHPTINTDVLAAGKLSKGDRTLHCLAESMETATAHIYRLESHGEAPAKALGAFRDLYTPAKVAAVGEWTDEADEARKHPTVFPVQLLPGVVESREVPIPCDGKPHDIKLAELFPGAPESAMYFMEVNGKVVADHEKPGARYVNQGIVQVTDLGLMWKTGSGTFFGYAYRLSDGKPLPAGTLVMQDAQGKSISTLEVKDGIAQGTLQPGTAYLQLVSGNDSYTVAQPKETGAWPETALNRGAAEEVDKPRTEEYMFTDRSLYRPGETAHVKGYLRTIDHGKFSVPKVAAATAKLDSNGTPVPVTVEADGSFALDLPLPEGKPGSCYLSLEYTLAGEDKPRRGGVPIQVEEFQRDEFEVKQQLTVNTKEQWVEISTGAAGFNGTPVAGGSASWELFERSFDFSSDACPDYEFGNHAEGWETDGFRGDGEGTATTAAGLLDRDGRGTRRMALSKPANGNPVALVAGCTVTNGNQRSVRFAEARTIHPADVYAGVRCNSRVLDKGESAAVSLLAVGTDGKPVTGEAVPCKLTVQRHSYRSYRYGLGSTSVARNVPKVQTVAEQNISLTGTAQSVPLNLPEAGEYRVAVEGMDRQGRPFRTATTIWVAGTDAGEEAPWEYLDYGYMALVSDKEMYEPGETARLLVQTTVDTEAIVTVEREGVMRYYKQPVTVANPVVSVPLGEADAPGVDVSVFLVQAAGAKRAANGLPLVKRANKELRVNPVSKRLAVQIDQPASPQQPGAPATLTGVVKDAAGRPVANAGVTLYAEDEGTLQIRGYSLPDPIRHFYLNNIYSSVSSFSTLLQMHGDAFKTEMLGNKGVFIGGGDDDGPEATATALRTNFNPCALWLANVRTDARGRFTAEYKNPDTLTRYRVMAVAAAEADKFGAGQGSYEVNKAVMLEPAPPAQATLGDILDVPVTISMNPDLLPADRRNTPVTWRISLSGSNVTVPEPERTVTLTGNSPATVSFPVKMAYTGGAALNWRATCADAGVTEADATQLSFNVVPATPFLREAIYEAIETKESVKAGDLATLDFRSDSKVSLDFSANPLTGAAQGMDMLVHYPYGCSEQLASRLLPWAFQAELQQCIGMQYPANADRTQVIAKVVDTLRGRFTQKTGFSYWGNGGVTEFSPHVALSLLLAAEKGTPLPAGMGSVQLCEMLAATAAQQAGTATGALAAYALAAVQGNGAAQALQANVAALKKDTDARIRWALALAARLNGDTRAADLAKQAAAAPLHKEWSVLPPVRTLRMLDQIARDPKSTATMKAVREYVAYDAQHFGSTYENAWLCMVLHQFIKAADVANVHAAVNGHELDIAKKWSVDTTVGDAAAYTAESGTVFVSGLAEGFQNKEQPAAQVDKGFKVHRKYERYMPDGTWKATEQFRVGDIVRVTLDCKPTKDTGRYTVLEDRLPAAFEAVNPALTSQDVPQALRDNPGLGWGRSGCVDNAEYGKGSVAFFTSTGGTFQCSYIARVVKSGVVTAPAAKAEMMYTPQNYGLAIPQTFTVTQPQSK